METTFKKEVDKFAQSSESFTTCISLFVSSTVNNFWYKDTYIYHIIYSKNIYALVNFLKSLANALYILLTHFYWHKLQKNKDSKRLFYFTPDNGLNKIFLFREIEWCHPDYYFTFMDPYMHTHSQGCARIIVIFMPIIRRYLKNCFCWKSYICLARILQLMVCNLNNLCVLHTYIISHTICVFSSLCCCLSLLRFDYSRLKINVMSSLLYNA